MKYDELKDKFIFYNAGKKGEVTKYMNKENIIKLAEKCGLNTIKTWKLTSKKIPDDMEYPCLTKAIISTKDNWKADSIVCNNEKELKSALNKIDSKEILVQKYIKKKMNLLLMDSVLIKARCFLMHFQLNYLSINDNAFGNYMIIKNFDNKELEKKLNKILNVLNLRAFVKLSFW